MTKFTAVTDDGQKVEFENHRCYIDTGCPIVIDRLPKTVPWAMGEIFTISIEQKYWWENNFFAVLRMGEADSGFWKREIHLMARCKPLSESDTYILNSTGHDALAKIEIPAHFVYSCLEYIEKYRAHRFPVRSWKVKVLDSYSYGDFTVETDDIVGVLRDRLKMHGETTNELLNSKGTAFARSGELSYRYSW